MERTVSTILALFGALIIAMGALVYSTNAKLRVLETEVKEHELLLPSTFNEIMPEYAERFHVLHFAGDAGDWAVAKHELQSLREIRKKAEIIDPKRGALLLAFERQYLDPLEHSIEDGDRGEFMELIAEVPQGCNNCHDASGSPFIKISLDLPDILSLRHPHVLEETALEEREHKH